MNERFVNSPLPGGPDSQEAAQAAAFAWLALLDDEKHVECWEQSASLFRNTIPQDQWVDVIRSAHAPMGKVRSRSLSGAVRETTLPGAPEGVYVVIRYSTCFEHKENAIDTVTPMLDQDGIWRV